MPKATRISVWFSAFKSEGTVDINSHFWESEQVHMEKITSNHDIDFRIRAMFLFGIFGDAA